MILLLLKAPNITLLGRYTLFFFDLQNEMQLHIININNKIIYIISWIVKIW